MVHVNIYYETLDTDVTEEKPAYDLTAFGCKYIQCEANGWFSLDYQTVLVKTGRERHALIRSVNSPGEASAYDSKPHVLLESLQ